MARLPLPAIVSVAAVLVAAAAVMSFLELGPLAAHMALHIAVMNIAAPFVAIALMYRPLPEAVRTAPLWIAGAIQIVLLWTWHIPSVQRSTMESGLLQILMHGSLFLVALYFWRLLLIVPARWQAIFLLLLTGKLSCLLGALLIFAPRVLTHHHSAISELNDQQLAGLLMITACPLSYVTAGVVLAAQIMADLGSTSGTSGVRKHSAIG
jgi:putative membrane protein